MNVLSREGICFRCSEDVLCAKKNTFPSYIFFHFNYFSETLWCTVCGCLSINTCFLVFAMLNYRKEVAFKIKAVSRLRFEKIKTAGTLVNENGFEGY